MPDVDTAEIRAEYDCYAEDTVVAQIMALCDALDVAEARLSAAMDLADNPPGVLIYVETLRTALGLVTE